MNKDKKLRLLIVPLIFMVLLFVPAMILYIIPNAYLLGREGASWNPCMVILMISALIWCVTFYYIPIGVYIAMLAVYTVVSWTWILRKKKGNAMYFIVWLVLSALSILMYWKWGDLYYCLLNG